MKSPHTFRSALSSASLILLAAFGPASMVCGEDAQSVGGVVWQRSLTDAVYTTTAISRSDTSLCAGTFLNPPQQAELIPLEGPGVPDWSYPGTYVEVDASRDAEVVAATDARDSDSTVTVRKWHADSGTPDWSYTISPCERALFRSIAVSADGSAIAVLVTMRTSPSFCRLYMFDADSGVPLLFDAPDGTFARNIAITDGGDYAAFRAGSYVYVVAAATGTARWSENFMFSSDPIAISGNGDYLAYGSTGLFVRRWNGSIYEFQWALFDPTFFLSACAVSSDGSSLAAGWYLPPFPFAQIKMVFFNTPSSTPLWTRLYAAGGGPYADYLADVDLTPDGSFIAVCSNGDSLNTNPEIQVFHRGGPTPLLTVDTPGSMFDVDVALGPGGGVYVAACGKHVHANALGRGGDLYSLRVEGTGVEGSHGPGGSVLSLEAFPNPSGAQTTVRFRLEEPAFAQIRIYSPAGELVRTLHEGFLPAGPHAAIWDGSLESGRAAPSGVYLARLDASGRASTRRIVVLR